MSTPALPEHYRVFEVMTSEGVCAFLQTFRPVTETSEGYWMPRNGYKYSWLTIKEMRAKKLLRWVSKHTTKRYCYPTVEQAVSSFKARKRRQLRILKAQLERVQIAVDGAHKLSGATKRDFLPHGVVLGGESLAANFILDL